MRPAAAIRVLAGVLLAALLLLGPGARPAAAGAPANCCICSICVPGPLTICFEGTSCEASCTALSCFSSESAPGFCSSQPECSQFVPAAPAPALAPYGLAVAAVVLTGFGLRGLRRRR